MTEAQWLACTDPDRMLERVRYSYFASARKLRLFAVACCRRIWRLFADDRNKKAGEMLVPALPGQAPAAGVDDRWIGRTRRYATRTGRIRYARPPW